uniref:Apolipoprotein A-IV n=1 Tax=Cavia porcellus TaxID=10141 RepID=H0WBC9_CAVPO
MFLKAVVLGLALLVVTSAQEDVSADQVATVVWNYFSQLGNNAKEAVEDLRKSDINHELNTGEGSTEAGRGAGILAASSCLYVLESDHILSLRLMKEKKGGTCHMASNTFYRRNLMKSERHLGPYAKELHSQVSKQAEQLRSQLTPYVQRMENVLQENMDSLQASLIPYADDFKAKFDKNMEELKGRLMPHVEGLKAKIDQNMEELRRSLAPYAQGAQTKLNLQLEGLAVQMKKNAEEFQGKISTNADELQQRLMPMVEDVRSKLISNTEGLQKSVAQLSSYLDQQVEEFQRNMKPYEETFNRALVQQMEQLRQKLGPHARDAEGHLSFLEKDLRDQVSSFFSTLEENQDKPLALVLPEEAAPGAGRETQRRTSPEDSAP